VLDIFPAPLNFAEYSAHRKETMGNRPAGYWILVAIAIAALVGAYMMQSSPNPHNHEIARYLRYGGAGAILIAILFFRGKTQPTPPMPRD
jgi:uncharacterized membrane protein YfcA